MISILVVCLGNICRSPLAHGILQSKLPETKFYVDSAGTAAYHIGEKPDTRSILVAKEHGIDISIQSARQFVTSDFDTFDIIYAMDQSNFDNITNLARTTADINKIKLFLDENHDVVNKNVPDPYYGDANDFNQVFDLIEHTSNQLVKKLQS